MARKRGGLAGLYDRNKGLIRTAATIGGSLLGGPGAGAAIGAAFRGLDREGKRGIGFDVGQGLRGAAEGYTTGKLTGAAKSSIGKMLAPKMPAGALNMDVINADIARGLGGGAPASASSALPSVAAPDAIGMTNTMMPGQSVSRFAAPTPQMTAPDTIGMTKTKAPGLLSKAGTKATEAMDFANKYEKPLGAMIRGTGLVPNPEAEALAAKNQIEQDKLEFERRQYADMQERQMRIAQLLAPMYQQMMAGRGGSPSNLPSGMPGASAVRDFGTPNYQSLASMQGAVPDFGQYADMDEGDDEVSPLRTGVSPLRTGVSPLRTGVSPLRTGVSPLSSTVSPMRTGVRPLRR